MATKTAALPVMVPFPEATWRKHIVPEEWEACLDAWLALAGAHLSLSNPDFVRLSLKDESLSTFLSSYAAETAVDTSSSLSTHKTKQLRKMCYLLSHRLLDSEHPPQSLLHWDFLADLSKIYGRIQGGKFTTLVWKKHLTALEISLASLKTLLTSNLEAGLKGDLSSVESQLKRLNHLLHASPEVSAFFMAGSDFVDSLISCYKITNPPLRKAIITTAYLCLIGLTEGSKPNFSSLVDQLYSLKVAAEAHKTGPTNVNNSMVAELVTGTPILKQVQQRIEASGSGSSRAKTVLSSLSAFKKAGGSGKPPRLIKRKIDKGKKKLLVDDSLGDAHVHIHRMSLISQIQDLFPDLGSGFVVKLLDEYNDNVEEVISHLLEGSLPAHLKSADRSEALPATRAEEFTESISDSAPFLPPVTSTLPIRRNIYDDDDFDNLRVSTSKLHYGRRNPDMTAEDMLEDRSTAPNKAAILSALAAFDSDDDERDDTYDTADVGGTVDSTNPEEAAPHAQEQPHDEVLFKAYKANPKAFGRDADTRRSRQRSDLRLETGMTDEAIEGWGLMLSRDARQMRRLEAKFSTFRGHQNEIAPTAWRDSGNEESDADGGNGSRGRGGGVFRGRGRGGGGGGGGAGRGRGNGNVAGPTGDKDTEAARHRKEANKGSRANHNRRDQRARKMARGGFPG